MYDSYSFNSFLFPCCYNAREPLINTKAHLIRNSTHFNYASNNRPPYQYRILKGLPAQTNRLPRRMRTAIKNAKERICSHKLYFNSIDNSNNESVGKIIQPIKPSSLFNPIHFSKYSKQRVSAGPLTVGKKI